MANTLSSIGGFLSAFMVGELTYQNVGVFYLLYFDVINLFKYVLKLFQYGIKNFNVYGLILYKSPLEQYL